MYSICSAAVNGLSGMFNILLNQSFSYLNIREAHPHQEVGRPIRETSDCNSSWPGPLAEELSHDEPGDGAGANFKEGYKTEDGPNADIGHPFELVLKTQDIPSPSLKISMDSVKMI